MGFLIGLLTVVYFITCVILIIVVLMQEPKGGGLSSAFGGSGLDTAFGASIGRKMSSFTVWLAVFFVILTVSLAILSKTGSGALSGSVMEGVRVEKKGTAPGPAGRQPAAPDQQEGAQPPEVPKGAKPPSPAERQESRPEGAPKASPRRAQGAGSAQVEKKVPPSPDAQPGLPKTPAMPEVEKKDR